MGAPALASAPMPTPPQAVAVIDMVEVDALAAKLAAADGLDWAEVCGSEADDGDGCCDSSTCVASHYEDHDPDVARDGYRRYALTALAHAPRGDDALHRTCAEVTRWCDHVERFAYDRAGAGLDASPHMLATVARRLVTIVERSADAASAAEPRARTQQVPA